VALHVIEDREHVVLQHLKNVSSLIQTVGTLVPARTGVQVGLVREAGAGPAGFPTAAARL
ncbi:hypothetical protein, partial [Klebsiella pneumoniae]|uniref:hypothetical protein n=1 Tax=Klebsiella pneumoniae TaxID=573 RepID=UPI00272F9690